MKIGKTSLSPWQYFQILLSLAVFFAVAIVYFKSGEREEGLVKIKRILKVPSIKVSRQVSLDELLKKAHPKPSEENIVNLNSSDDEDFFGPQTPNPENKKTTKASGSAKINLNAANVEELMTIDGMSEATARSIVNYRKKMGEIWELDELKVLPGINDAFLKKIKDKVVIK